MVKKKSKVETSVKEIRAEFKKQLTTGVTAAFAFLVALTWREPIAETINWFIQALNITTGELFFKYLSALIFTVMAVIPLIIIARFNSEKSRK